MALTAKPISTISYNTKQFLDRKLEQMIEAKIIVDYRYIQHEGEDGDKDHIHLLMYPNKRVDTGVLQEEFNEVPNGTAEEKPLGVMPFRTSKTDHWLMYVLHDIQYLHNHKSDNDGDGKIEYDLTDIVTPYPEQLARDYKKALALRNTENQEVINRLMIGQQATQIIYDTGINPMKVLAIRNALIQDETAKAFLKDHEEEIETAKKALEIADTVKIVEELPQLKAEQRMGTRSKRITEYRLNYMTGEVEPVTEEIKDVIEDE